MPAGSRPAAESLSTEVIIAILSHAKHLPSSSRNEFLCSASLIAKAWKGPAQLALNGDVSLPTEDLARAFLRGPPELVSLPQTLELHGNRLGTWGDGNAGGVSLDSIRGLAAAVRRLSGLALVKVDGLDVRVFSTPGMRGKSNQIKQRRQCTQILSPALRHLKLRDVAFSSREHYDVPPLHLTSLSLHKFLGAPNLLPSLINTSSSSLRVLSFTFADVWSGSSKTDETLARSIHILSPSLHTLNLNFFTFEPSLLLVPIISSLQQLHSLH